MCRMVSTLIGSIVILAPLARLIAVLLTPVVNSTLIRIGDIIQSSTNTNPIIMGIILGSYIYGCRHSAIEFNGIRQHY